MVMSGKSPGGPRPFGFEKDGLTIRESEAEEIRRMVTAAAGGQSLRSLMRDLNERGILTSRGNKWTIQKLRLVLTRPRNAGVLVYQGNETGAAPWPPIVDELTWRQMCLIFADPARRTVTSYRVSSLGSGLYKCGKCGAKMHISASGTGAKVRGYRCSEHNHLTQAAAPLDEYVIRRISELIRRPEYLSAAVEAMQEPAGKPDEGRIGAANARLAELGEMFAAGDIDGRTLKTATEKLRAQIGEAEKALVETARPWGTVAPAALRWVQENPREALREMPLDRQRGLLAWLATVTVMPATARGSRFDPGRVKFEWTGAAKRIMPEAARAARIPV